jgi:hypothetical protein
LAAAKMFAGGASAAVRPRPISSADGSLTWSLAKMPRAQL